MDVLIQDLDLLLCYKTINNLVDVDIATSLHSRLPLFHLV